MPRETKLTPKVQADMVDAITAGNTIIAACRYAGISEGTYYRWLEDALAEPEDAPDLNKMPIGQLRKLAADANIVIPKGARRDKILQILVDAGIDSRAPYRKFREAIVAAEARLEVSLVVALKHVMQGDRDPATGAYTRLPDTKTILAFLARRFPKSWSPTQIVELSGRDGGAVDVNVAIEDSLARRVKDFLDGADTASTMQQPTKEKNA